MYILFDNWIIILMEKLPARQYDNLSRRLFVTGWLPSGWDWYMKIHCKGHHEEILLSQTRGGYEYVLTADQLSFGGCKCDMQLKGVQGDIVRHTNVINVHIPASLS